jgi:hypothetical protein
MHSNRRSKLIRIFVSHRAKEGKIAHKLTKILQQQPMTGVDFFLSENIPKGAEWRVELKKALYSCSALILLYTDPTEDWSWCLYEVGYFATRKKPIYCLHSPALRLQTR